MTKNIRTLFFNNKKQRMIKKNQNWVAVVVGTVGSGKTYGALTISDEMMNQKHDPNVHEVFSIEEFTTKYNDGSFKKADVVVFEEAGVNISAKNWQSKANKNINFVLQTCRHRNFAIIFTLPMFKFLDASTRALIHTVFVANEKNIDYDRKINYLTVYDMKVDALRGKEPFTIFPKFWVDGRLIAMKRVAVKMPREEILEVYEKRKSEFTAELNKKIEEQMKADNEETENKRTKTISCAVCNASSWRYFPSVQAYRCRKCGYETVINPFETKKEVKEDE